MKTSVLTLAVFMGLASTNALAAATDLTVAGTITPAACTPSLSNGGLVDYGSLALTELEESQHLYALPAKSLNFSIECSAPATFAVIANDNRRDSSGINPWQFGLGKHQDQVIGYFFMTMFQGNTLVDGAQGYHLSSEDAGNTWNYVITGSLLDTARAADYRAAFSSTGSDIQGPTPASSVHAIMDINGVINKNLTLNGAMALDGSATIEVVYL
ncbi:DUF1120 domain-containing protein [Pseudomonas vranovensis]|uniref:DUF1120 domain-containing protein n=1 Tax=Pseudomonas vranovensis TaxID=321661 RepID=UPI003D96A2EE